MDGQTADDKPHIVVLGAGFGGLQFCQNFPRGLARITLIDRHNHHLFQPLLYQVAMAGLAAPDIAAPTRSIFRRRPDITVLMDEVQTIDLAGREVRLCDEAIDYDYLVVGLGGITSYFGKQEWAKHAPGLKSINDALEIRRRILTSFEQAESTGNEEERRTLMTIVVVGGGPTGVELAGSMAELCNQVFRRDFRRINPRDARVILIDGGDRLLKHYPAELSASAQQQLEELGVEVRLSQRVVNVTSDHVELKGGTVIETRNILWGAGVIANPVTAKLDVDLGVGGRINVRPDLSIPGFPDVFAIGDIVSIAQENGEPVPGVAPAAMQMGRHVAGAIAAEIRADGQKPERTPFRYVDKGSMATIGRNRAVAWMGRIKLTGFPAWLAWLLIHLLFLVSFRDKLAVLMEWGYNYLTFRRGARIIFGSECGPEDPEPAVPEDAHEKPTPPEERPTEDSPPRARPPQEHHAATEPPRSGATRD